ncbi:hypothetical protein, partial [Klebsiella pneumoniae]|uniref:hypothetical protein n=1 Tax=Klebsiella pneumoniae TaxID=573 RepID=UPI003013C8C0
ITPQRLQRKRQFKAEKRRRHEKSVALAKEYNEKLAKFHKDNAAKRIAEKHRSASRKESTKAQ